MHHGALIDCNGPDESTFCVCVCGACEVCVGRDMIASLSLGIEPMRASTVVAVHP